MMMNDNINKDIKFKFIRRFNYELCMHKL